MAPIGHLLCRCIPFGNLQSIQLKQPPTATSTPGLALTAAASTQPPTATTSDEATKVGHNINFGHDGHCFNVGCLFDTGLGLTVDFGPQPSHRSPTSASTLATSRPLHLGHQLGRRPRPFTSASAVASVADLVLNLCYSRSRPRPFGPADAEHTATPKPATHHWSSSRRVHCHTKASDLSSVQLKQRPPAT